MPLDVTHGMAAPDNSHISPTFVNVAFRDPDAFMACNIHANLPSWQRIAAVAPYDRAQEVLKWIEHRVDAHQFFVLFKGDYRGQSYNSDVPPHRVFCNSISCKPFVSFISRTILDRLATGAISVWGRVGDRMRLSHLI